MSQPSPPGVLASPHRRLRLRTVFTALNVGLLLLFGASVAALTYAILRSGFQGQLDLRGQALAELLSRAVAQKLYFKNEQPEIADTIDALKGQRDVVLVAVTNKTGSTVARSAAPGLDGDVADLIARATSARGTYAARGGDVVIYRAAIMFHVPTQRAETGLDDDLGFAHPAEPAKEAGAGTEEREGTAFVGLSREAMRSELNHALFGIVLVTLGATVLASFVAFWVTRSLTRPLGHMVEFAAAMSHGDYQRVGDVQSQTREVGELADAFGTMRLSLALVADQARRIAAGDLSQGVAGAGQLGETFNSMVGSLSKLVGQIKKASIRIASAGSEILAASRQAEKGSAEQASSINQTTTTMDELLSASKQIAVSADAVVKIAERTLVAAKAGEDAVQQSITGMEEIATNNRQTAERILELSERNQQIGNIVDLIDEIADKSDLLALNAAIEGAKAGEAGKGFAVVATEMRALAENVVESTKEIKALITEIQKASNASVLATEGQMKATERGTQIALKTGEQLREILQMVVQTTEAAKQISLATQQQRTGTEQVVQSMAEIAKIAKTNVAGASQTTTSTGELASLADDLKQAVSQFRLAQDA